MTLRHLKVFVCVCEQGSITKAANLMNIVQPAVSNTVCELEKFYNVELFHRIKKKLILTDEGKKLFVKAKNVLDSFDQFEETALKSAKSPTVKIGSSLTIGKMFMPYIIKKIGNEFPDVELKAQINQTAAIEKKVSDGELDFAFTEGQPIFPDLDFTEIAKERLIAVCGKDYDVPSKIDLRQLKDANMLLRERGSASRDFFESVMNLNHIKISPLLESVSNQAIISAAENCLGIAILSGALVAEQLKKGALKTIDVSGFDFERALFAVYRKNAGFHGIKKQIFDLSINEFMAVNESKKFAS